MATSLATGPNSDLIDQVMARLTARLDSRSCAPVAVAVSGGGDSVALLDLVAGWARRHARPVVALTVDHRLNPDSDDWCTRSRDLAHSLGCRWQGLVWEAPTPGPGLSARARTARHALLADATRRAGAKVLIMGHTLDDRQEATWMRVHEGSNLGAMREWAPSPCWPQGRGLMVFRPLLDLPRQGLRDHLRQRGLTWIEDPANADLRFGRSRARRALAGRAFSNPPSHAPSDLDSTPRCDAWGGVDLTRQTPPRTLAMALVVTSGGTRLPRREQIERLCHRLADGENFTATLLGSRLSVVGDRVRVSRQWGPRSGQALAAPLALEPGVPVIWDGRFEVWTEASGWLVAAAGGRLAQLCGADRQALSALAPAERVGQPVLIGPDGLVPILARPGVNQRSWVGHRLILALDQMTREDQIDSLEPDRLRWNRYAIPPMP